MVPSSLFRMVAVPMLAVVEGAIVGGATLSRKVSAPSIAVSPLTRTSTNNDCWAATKVSKPLLAI